MVIKDTLCFNNGSYLQKSCTLCNINHTLFFFIEFHQIIIPFCYNTFSVMHFDKMSIKSSFRFDFNSTFATFQRPLVLGMMIHQVLDTSETGKTYVTMIRYVQAFFNKIDTVEETFWLCFFWLGFSLILD